MGTHRIEITFDYATGFDFAGMKKTVVGPRLEIPADERESTLELIRGRGTDWKFRAIHFLGTSGSALPFINCWRTVRDTAGAPTLVGDSEVYMLSVESIAEDRIVLRNRVAELPVNIGFNFQVTIEDAAGHHWTSVDPQVINEKKPGG